MDILFAPWRMRYIKGESRTADDGSCLLCEIPREGVSRDRLVLFRGDLCYIVMNAFPYTSGHLMVVPLGHGASMGDFALPVLAEMTGLLRECERIIGELYRPGGFNMGINVGGAAGAGIAGHLHAHILPRWEGDTNFLTTVAEARVVPEDLRESYDRLLPAFSRLATDRLPKVP